MLKIYKANLLYDQLYALRFLLKNEGDSYELLWGHGLLTWKHGGIGTIYAPIFLTPLTLDFDASKRVIEISPDPVFRGFTDKIHFETELNFKDEDLEEIYALLIELNPEERQLHRFELPAISNLPSEDAATGVFSSYRDLSAKVKTSNKVFIT